MIRNMIDNVLGFHAIEDIDVMFERISIEQKHRTGSFIGMRDVPNSNQTHVSYA